MGAPWDRLDGDRRPRLCGLGQQELLARRAEGALAVDLTAVRLLNGGLPRAASTGAGPARAARRGARPADRRSAHRGAVRGWADADDFASSFDATVDAAEMWRALANGSGQLIAHLLIRYIRDREAHGERWVSALESTEVQLGFVWGMRPGLGAHMAQRIRERLRAAVRRARGRRALAAAGSSRAGRAGDPRRVGRGPAQRAAGAPSIGSVAFLGVVDCARCWRSELGPSATSELPRT